MLRTKAGVDAVGTDVGRDIGRGLVGGTRCGGRNADGWEASSKFEKVTDVASVCTDRRGSEDLPWDEPAEEHQQEAPSRKLHFGFGCVRGCMACMYSRMEARFHLLLGECCRRLQESNCEVRTTNPLF
jgi:hypothetical protein